MAVDESYLIRRELCARVGAEFMEAAGNQMIAIASNVREGLFPLNGVRYMPEGNSTGWFIWAGEDTHPEDDNFYNALHANHINEWNPLLSKYLGLSPGWRFLIAGDYEDVWFDPDILNAPTVL